MSLARQGVQILIAETDRPGGCQARATADRVKHETAVQRVAAQTDVSRRDQVERFVAGTAEEFGRIRILVHNAGDRPLAALLADHRRPMGAELGG
jgi:NAD(P)-dependent dehydrogenase (short-subunit alcohol dehydrogenase family)